MSAIVATGTAVAAGVTLLAADRYLLKGRARKELKKLSRRKII